MKKTIFILTLLLPICFLFAQPDSDVDQFGKNNSVTVEQTGTLNHSVVYTVGRDNLPSFVTQEGDGVNESDVYQVGDDNWADVYQKNFNENVNDENWSDIDQVGSVATAIVRQWIVAPPDAYAGNAGNLNSTVYQEGIGNDAEVWQKGKRLNARITQMGDNSNALIHQGTSKYAEGDPAYVSKARIRQGYNTDDESYAMIDQVGMQNDAFILQNTSASKAGQVQINANATLVGTQTDVVNSAQISQGPGFLGSSGNIAFQLQYYEGSGGPNVANVLQIGRNHYSHEIQIGGDNESDVFQQGNRNEAKVYQNTNGVGHPDLDSPLPPAVRYPH